MQKSQCTTLKKQFGVLLQQLDEMAKNVNAAVKEGDVAVVQADTAGEGDDASAAALSGAGVAIIWDCIVPLHRFILEFCTY